MLNFNDFINEQSVARKTAAGVAIFWNHKILLVHPTNASWTKRVYGIPKGGINDGEDERTAAIREVYEETGIKLDPNKLSKTPETADQYLPNGKFVWQLVYYSLKIDELSDIGLTTEVIPKEQLQNAEINWAGFVPFTKAYAIIHTPQMIILDRYTK